MVTRSNPRQHRSRPGHTSLAVAGLTPAELLRLPDDLQQVLRWLMRQRQATLAEIVAHTDLTDAEVAQALNDGLRQGFVTRQQEEGAAVYRPALGLKRMANLPDAIQQSLTPGSPLVVISNPSTDAIVTSGETFELGTTITNVGGQPAVISVFLAAESQLASWCPRPRDQIALSPQQSGEVFFQVQVPPQALPGTYPYTLVVDAPQHYPEDTPIHFSQRLQVLPPIQNVVRVSDPTFRLDPPTSTDQPAALQPGQALDIRVLVHNRSDRVDRFRLSCPDLDPQWYSVRYPDNLDLGLVTQMDGLALNPGASGQITLLLTPPPTAIAGHYCATLQLHAANSADQTLLEMVYLQVLPLYNLTANLQTLRSQVTTGAGRYSLQVTNAGNVPRTIALQVQDADDEGICRYNLTADQVQIPPHGTAQVDLSATPQGWWRRPFVGGGRLVNFAVGLEDCDRLPLANTRFPGLLVWKPRPWWHLTLLLLTSLGTIGAIAFAIWLAWLKPPAPPRVLGFAASDPAYNAADGEGIRLNWQVSSPEQIDRLRIVGRSPDGKALSPPVMYSFDEGVPEDLRDSCVLQTTLICQNVATDAHRPGDYVFEMAVFSERDPHQAIATQSTSTVQISPLPQPAVVEFSSTLPSYPADPAQGEAIVLLNWAVANAAQLRELRLVGRSPEGEVTTDAMRYDVSQGELPPELAGCTLAETLICEDVPVTVTQAKDTVFELTAIAQTASVEPVSKQTERIAIERRSPEILAFQVNGAPAQPRYLVELNRENPMRTLEISWQVIGGPETKVELLPSPGEVASQGSIPFTVSQQSGTTTVTLRVAAGGDAVSQSFTVEVFDSTPSDLPQLVEALSGEGETEDVAEPIDPVQDLFDAGGTEPSGEGAGRVASPPTPELNQVPPQFD